MASAEHSDLMMKFVNTDGTPVPGESQTQLTSAEFLGNPLLDGFKNGFFFEVSSFTFSASGDGKKPGMKPPKGLDPAQQRWAEQQAQDAKNKNAPSGASDEPPVQPISFKRDIDAASLMMMQNLIDRKGYKNATIIKRKAAGGKAAGEVFLRIDFTDVLITEIEWDDDDRVKEDCKFICRSLKIQYRPQLQDGSLGGAIEGLWRVQT